MHKAQCGARERRSIISELNRVTLAGSRVVGLSVSSETPPAAPEVDADGECDDADDALGEDSQLAFAVARPLLLSNILYTEGLPVWQPDTKREF